MGTLSEKFLLRTRSTVFHVMKKKNMAWQLFTRPPTPQPVSHCSFSETACLNLKWFLPGKPRDSTWPAAVQMIVDRDALSVVRGADCHHSGLSVPSRGQTQWMWPFSACCETGLILTLDFTAFQELLPCRWAGSLLPGPSGVLKRQCVRQAPLSIWMDSTPSSLRGKSWKCMVMIMESAKSTTITESYCFIFVLWKLLKEVTVNNKHLMYVSGPYQGSNCISLVLCRPSQSTLKLHSSHMAHRPITSVLPLPTQFHCFAHCAEARTVTMHLEE